MVGHSRSSEKTKQPRACVACTTRSAAARPLALLAREMNGCSAVRYFWSAMAVDELVIDRWVVEESFELKWGAAAAWHGRVVSEISPDLSAWNILCMHDGAIEGAREGEREGREGRRGSPFKRADRLRPTFFFFYRKPNSKARTLKQRIK